MDRVHLLLLSVALCCCALCSCPAAAAELVLVEAGAPRARILLPAEPTPTEQFAAEELHKYIEQVSGARLDVVTDAGDQPVVSVGRTALARSLDFPADPEFPDPYLIRTTDQGLVLVGRGDRGTIYAVYDLLYRLGCRWVFPGPLGDVIPRRESIVVENLDVVEEPDFEFRIGGGWRYPNYVDWAAKSRMQLYSRSPQSWTEEALVKRGGYVKGTMGHAFHGLVPERHFAEHPEYYSLRGERRVPGKNSQLCMTNEEVTNLVAAKAIAFFDQNPGARFFSLCPNDNYNCCQCAQCQAWDTGTTTRWERVFPVITDRNLQWVNQVGAQLKQRHPHKYLCVYAYHNYTSPPVNLRAADNVVISLCHMVPACYSHTLDDPECEVNAAFRELLDGWADVHDNMWYYAYTCKSMWEQMPWPIARRLAQDIRYLKSRGFRGFHSQGSGGIWGQLGVNSYVMAAMLWDTETDIEAKMDEYFTVAFGPAAEHMRAWFDTLEASFRAPDLHVHHLARVDGPIVLDADTRAECNRHLAAARQAAADDEAVLRRIAPVAAAFHYAEAYQDAAKAEAEYRASGDLEALRASVEAYRRAVAIAEENPEGEALSWWSTKKYVVSHLERMDLTYELLFAPPGESRFKRSEENLLSNASFEEETGWAQPAAGDALSRERAREPVRTGEWSLRFAATPEAAQGTRAEALKHNWVLLDVRSNSVAVRTGSGYLLSAYVNVPADMQETTRGAIINLVARDQEGTEVQGWKPGTVEARRAEATDGWERLIVARVIEDEAIATIEVRLGIVGLGELFFDDIELLEAEPIETDQQQ